eukprot:gb/GFBE01067798.1/.p1 GENE.gb/GFBE01067798.1/~~gb/GFBE01067798.1/.p1  ORF type:complete len:147 (+),score=20.91 gb/GFBE01067798.1/:1-441(+)
MKMTVKPPYGGKQVYEDCDGTLEETGSLEQVHADFSDRDEDSASDSESGGTVSDYSDIMTPEERAKEAAELAQLEREVPRTDEGQPTSVGSYNHPEKCSPCIFFAHATAECSRGIRCEYCHFPHAISKQKLLRRLLKSKDSSASKK